MGKTDKIFKVSLVIFTLESTEGHLNWKITELSRRARMSRSLIYRYFGSSKKEIFKSAFKVFIEKFYGFSDEDEDISFEEKVRQSRELLKNHGEAIIFYQKWRNTDSEFRDIFIDIEKRFQANLKNLFPHKSDLDVRIMHACLHGLVASPFMEPDEAKEGFLKLVSYGVLR